MSGRRKNDPKDAEFLARQGRADTALLHPVQHRSAQAQMDLAVIRARDQLVRARTKLVNHVRGAVKAQGSRVRKCSAEAFIARAVAELPDETRPALEPLLDVIVGMTQKIREYDRQIERLASTSYPEAKLKDSSASQPQLRISKAGDELGRRLLVSAAQYVLGPFGPDCDLRRHGLKIAARGGKNAKKRAAVAVARKLAVLLHRLWVSGATYDPDWVLKRHVA